MAKKTMMRDGTIMAQPLHIITPHHRTCGAAPVEAQQRAGDHRAENVADGRARVPHTHHQAAPVYYEHSPTLL